MIRIENLSKTFRGRPALCRVSLEVQRGEIFGLLGHNGAGKSTTFGILLGQVYADEGEAFIDGISVQRDRARALAKVGAIFEAPGFYDYMSGWQNLSIFASYSGHVPRALRPAHRGGADDLRVGRVRRRGDPAARAALARHRGRSASAVRGRAWHRDRRRVPGRVPEPARVDGRLA